MTFERHIVFDAVRRMLGRGFTGSEVLSLDDAITAALRGSDCPTYDPAKPITCRVALEIVNHEAIVPEAYKDSEGVWTWAAGVTDASGHGVLRYKDNPQSLERCLEVSVWLMRTKYAPEVKAAFSRPLTEAQFAAALSFHYNTGAIGRADWVKSWNVGHDDVARQQIMNWKRPASIIERRGKERDLFFEGRWSQDGKATVYQVSKPSYCPKWSSAKRVDVSGILADLLKVPA